MIYLFKSDKCYKIGYTNNIEKRLKGVNCFSMKYNNNKFHCDNHFDTLISNSFIENLLHYTLRKYNIASEYFEINKNVETIFKGAKHFFDIEGLINCSYYADNKGNPRIFSLKERIYLFENAIKCILNDDYNYNLRQFLCTKDYNPDLAILIQKHIKENNLKLILN